MNWKREAIEKLTDYEARKASIKSIQEDVERLKSCAHAIRSAVSDGTPVSGGGSTREDMLLSNIVQREELSRKLQQNQLWVSTVDRSLSVLSKDERRILDIMYIHPVRGAVEILCEELYIERPTVYRRREEALKKFTIALYGIER